MKNQDPIIFKAKPFTLASNANKILKESQENYRVLFYNSPLPMWIYGLDNYCILDVNETAIIHYGYSREEFLSMVMIDLGPKENIPKFFSSHQDIHHHKGVVCFGVCMHQKKNKDLILVEVSGQAMSYRDKDCMMVICNDVTERERALQRLTDNEVRLLTAEKIAKLGYWQLSNDMKSIYWSDEVYSIWGVTKDFFQLNYQSFLKTIHPEDRECLGKEHDASFAGEKEHDTEYRIILPDGSVKWVHEKGNLNKGEDGKRIFFEGSVQDISEFKKSEIKLKDAIAQQSLFVSIVNSSDDAIISRTPDGIITSWNRGAETIFGYTKKEAVGNYIFFIIPDLINEPDICSEIDNGESVIHYETLRIKKDGSRINVSLTISPILDSNGNGIGASIIARETTEQKHAEEENKFKANLLNTIGQAVMATDLAGIINFWNKAAGEIYGWTVEEAIGKNVVDLIPAQQTKEQSSEIMRKLLQGHSWSGEFMVQRKGGHSFPVFVTDAPIYDQNHNLSGIIGVSFDITQRKKAEKDLKELTEQLRDLSSHQQNIREEERKRIGREIHDELGQQLTAIKMDMAWIDKKIPEETTALKSKLKNIINLLDQGNQSIRRILSELRPPILDDHGLLEAIEWLGREFTINTGIPVKFTTAEIEIKSTEPIATCIFRVHQEALTNITRYAHATKVSTSLAITDHTIIISIEDDGKGFDIAMAGNKKSFGILGMKERVLSLKGTFELISAPGKGTKIVISLPYNI